jgi:hypothetical protein
MKHIRQKTPKDCAIAATAMVLDIDYESAEVLYKENIRDEGIIYLNIASTLSSLGVGTRIWKKWQEDQMPIGKAILEVAVTKDSLQGHYVAMDDNGAIYDPAKPEPQHPSDYEIWRAIIIETYT